MEQVIKRNNWYCFEVYNVTFIDHDREAVLRKAAKFARQMIDLNWR